MSETDKANLVTPTDEGADPNGSGPEALSDSDKSASSSTWQRRLRCPPPRGMTLIVLVSVIFSAAITFALILTIIFGEPQVQKLGAVSADNTDAAKCGLTMLSNGGSAVDAAVAAALCNSVVQYPVTGLGGGGLLLVHSHRADKTTLLDFLETAPAAASAAGFASSGSAALSSALVTGTPGFARGLEEAHKRFGRLKWSSLFAPAIDLATKGFKMTPDLNRLVASYAAKLVGNPVLKRWYLQDGAATAKAVGSYIIMPELANALKLLRDEGADTLYTGALSKELLKASSDHGGILTSADLAGYRVVERSALVGHYRNYTIRTFPPPSSGGVYTVLLAQVLAGYPVPSTDSVNSTGILHHRFAEAAKLAHASIEPIGESSGSLASDLASPSSANQLRARIVDGRVLNATDSAAYSPYPWPAPSRPQQASSHLAVVDNDELYVSMETSLNSPFAAGLLTAPNAVLLNNALVNFDLTSGANHSNAVAGGRRPATLMSPAFAFNPRQRCGLRFAFGASNSTAVPGVTAWLLTRLSDLSADSTVCPRSVSSRRPDSSRQPCLPVKATAKLPRLNPLLPLAPAQPRLEVDPGLSAEVSHLLEDLGHRLAVKSEGLARSQIVAMDMYSLAADSDTARSGATAEVLPQSRA